MTRSVLIVDDHEGFRLQARRLLEMAGYDVVGEAANGAAGIAAAGALKPDVVLLDVQLPDMTGFDVAKSLAGGSSVIVLISSRTASDYGTRVASSGALGFISKFDLSGAALEAILGRVG